jgi:hypothetical protein
VTGASVVSLTGALVVSFAVAVSEPLPEGVAFPQEKQKRAVIINASEMLIVRFMI